jgi:prepilin-type N-terminal cleavage/methylation domain-containing protein
MGRKSRIRRRSEPNSGPVHRCDRPIKNHRSRVADSRAFTLIELLVVIAIIALLLAIFLPALQSAREQGQRAACLGNLRHLTLAWTQYADEHDGRLVRGAAYGVETFGMGSGPGISVIRTSESWVGQAFHYPKSRSTLIKDPAKGALWPYIRDIDVYRCRRARQGHALTYTTVVAANGVEVEGTSQSSGKNVTELTWFGKRVGRTMLRLTRLTDIAGRGASERAIFMDQGETPTSDDFYVFYLYPQWRGSSPPPLHHADGVTLSMADAHAEYWKWKSRETVAGLPRQLVEGADTFTEMLLEDGARKDYEPQTEDGLDDLQRVQRATWGRLGYSLKKGP